MLHLHSDEESLSLASGVINRGIHAFVEKPLSFSSKECEDLVELARNKKVILTAGYIERYNPVVQDVKRIIQSKKYGEPLMMEFHRENRMPVHITDVGIIYDTSVHDIDTAMYLFDSKPIVVFARTGKIPCLRGLCHNHAGFRRSESGYYCIELDHT